MEDLERRAGSSDEAEPEKKPSPSKSNKRQASATAKAQKHQPAQAKHLSQGQFTPPMDHADDLVFGTPVYDGRERSHTPPMFQYPAELLLDPYGSQPYPTMSASAAEPYSHYLTATSTMPATLPSMTQFSDAIKRESFTSDDGMSSYLNYSFVPGVDMNVPSPYDPSNPHVSRTPVRSASLADVPQTPPFDHSASCSETGYEYPTTPLSMPGSPGLLQHAQ